MPVRRQITHNEVLFFITFSRYKWLPLIDMTAEYDIAYSWFDYLKTPNHQVKAFVIIPNHIHVLVAFRKTEKSINKIIGDGIRFIAYEIIRRVEEKEQIKILDKLKKAVTKTAGQKGKKHEVWEESFDWKFCEIEKFPN